MSKELNELIQELGKIVDGNQSIVDELDKLKSLYEQLKLATADEFEYPFEENESYWLVDSKGKIVRSWWYEDSIDTTRYEMGNAFFTEEAAQKEKERRILLTSFRQFRDKCNGDWKPDWNNIHEGRYYIHLYPTKGECSIGQDVFQDSMPQFGRFKNVDDCLRAIELFGDEIKRLWVEE